MRVAYFDAVSGAAGDMILGALLDAGLTLEALERELAKLPVTGYRLRVERVLKQGIAAAQFLVDVEGEDHHHHGHETEAERQKSHGRSLASIETLIDESDLSETVRNQALRIFRRLGEAEARIHGVPLAQVHFHEVGAIDSIVDIVGAAIAFDLLHLDRIYASPLPIGSGTIETRHGVYPIPAPATLELVASAGAPVISSTIHAEQVTPTGAAILTAVARFERPPMKVERVGYGAGQADLEIPNVLRVWIGEAVEGREGDIAEVPSPPAPLPSWERGGSLQHISVEAPLSPKGVLDKVGGEGICILETNIDDMNPQLYDYVLDKLFGSGALDALLVPVIMKKGRPGVKVEVLCRPEDEGRLIEVLLRETSTLGVRSRRVERFAAEREIKHVETPYGTVAVKIKRLGGRAVLAAPEYEDCRRLAKTCDVALIEVYAAASAAARALV